MPTVQYIHNGNTHTRNMVTPKQITKLAQWYKEARRSLPQIPLALFGVMAENEWMVEHWDMDVKWIKFDLLSKTQERAYIVILRRS